MENLQVIVALGRIAFDGVLRLYRQRGLDLPRLAFTHGAVYRLGSRGTRDVSEDFLPWLVVSYHPSRQNTQTGRLTEAMFDEVWTKVRSVVNGA